MTTDSETCAASESRGGGGSARSARGDLALAQEKERNALVARTSWQKRTKRSVGLTWPRSTAIVSELLPPPPPAPELGANQSHATISAANSASADTVDKGGLGGEGGAAWTASGGTAAGRRGSTSSSWTRLRLCWRASGDMAGEGRGKGCGHAQAAMPGGARGDGGCESARERRRRRRRRRRAGVRASPRTWRAPGPSLLSVPGVSPRGREGEGERRSRREGGGGARPFPRAPPPVPSSGSGDRGPGLAPDKEVSRKGGVNDRAQLPGSEHTCSLPRRVQDAELSLGGAAREGCALRA